MSVSRELANQLREELKSAKNVLISTHLNPDGDAIGSALAFSHYLDGIGIPNHVICHHVPPRNLRFLPGVERVLQRPALEEYDLGVVLDLDSLDRLGNTAPYFENCKRLVVIDHHVPHEAPGDLRIIDTHAPATAVILTRLLIDLEAEITDSMASCLLTGIVTDTGSFRFRNTTPEALSLAATLLERGGNLTQISEEIFQSKSLASARMLGFLLERMQLSEDERLAWGALTHEDFKAAHARDEDTEGFVNEMLFIETVQIAAIFRQHEANKIRISLRSRAKYDVASIAREFGGGGHVNAAGCSFDGTLEEAVEQVVASMKRCLESS